MTRAAWRATIALAVLMLAAPAAAHVTATGLAEITAEDETITYRLTVVLAELPEEAGLMLSRAARGDQVAAGTLAESLRNHVVFSLAGEMCRPGRILIQGSDIGEPKATLIYRVSCSQPPGRLDLDEDWTGLFGAHYRTIVTVATAAGRSEFVLGEETHRSSVDFGARARTSLWSFIRLGVEHILTGYDHLLFLLALLVGASSLWRVLGIVTAFTLAHSITLSLAVTGLVRAPSAVVEPLIAATILWVAVENLLGQTRLWHRFVVTFLFGLVHGLGFADALIELALTGWPLARALIGFNVGVELGQAIAIAVALPVLLYLARLPHARLIYRGTSLFVASAGAYWLVQRLFFT
ncbi:MAG TPA: HupE/UreJ family protein [Stellaceae bacterium]|nr:HupE/UreJ family protein [Stellaceae bacterium]